MKIAREYSQNIDTKFKVFCSVQTGSKPFLFEWLKNGHILPFGANYQVESSEDDSLLTIFKLSPNDSGNYSCVAKNQFGSDSQSTLLSVKGLSETINWNSHQGAAQCD